MLLNQTFLEVYQNMTNAFLQRDFFTYYDIKQDEWEIYHPIASDVIPEGSHGALYIKEPYYIHIFGGETVNPDNRREKLVNNKVWTFDFKTNKWHFLS